MSEIAIPADFAQAMREVYGERGDAWLRALPQLLAEYAERWSLRIQPPFAPLTYNYVAPAITVNGSEVVLKLGVPNPELSHEAAALRLFDGRGSVRVLAAEPERGALLLERLQPGTSLEAWLEAVADDKAATAIAAWVMRALWVPAPAEHAFPTVAQWAAGLGRLRSRFGGGTGPLPSALVDRAERLFAELSASSAAPVVLHGDLHHGNILSAGREPWLAIDPKGLVGEPAYETGALLRNPLPQLLAQSDPARVLARRIDQLAEMLALDRARITGWGVYQAVLSAWWSIEDHGHGWEPAIACAELLAPLLP